MMNRRSEGRDLTGVTLNYVVHLTYEIASVCYYGYPDLTSYNLEFLSAVFTVPAGANTIQRPIAGGTLGYESLKNSNMYIL